uniref:NADH dehydrogenase subunit 2 n=1 Tax=Fischoederius elongatus TaxID=691745 RepID=A0A0M3LRH8_FISEL|nr:NADH dehydrogenase subunit 2 [Fischoederius elongatus]AJF22819.1 NADH dehydrogenase subunit 2 [Fischoederius elongatus]QIJ60106.1 NADH dehydrogenase subunit 2 [Fischoederius elongatus]
MVRGYFVSWLSLILILFFTWCFFSCENVAFLWLFIELASLSLIPSFFMYGGSDGLSGLFSYIVVSSIASSFMVCALVSSGLLVLFYLGLLIKFGVFPFFGWVYKVVVGSNWFVVWCFSTFLKSPFIFFIFFFLLDVGCGVVEYMCCLTFLLCTFLFWLYSFNWYYCWCHMMLVSSASLVAMSLVLSVDSLFYLFLVYVIWASLVIGYFSLCGDEMVLSSLGFCFLFCFLLVSFPLSLSVFYKLLMGSCIFSCSFLVFLCWVLYSLSEQFYLVKFVIGNEVPKSLFGVGSVV